MDERERHRVEELVTKARAGDREAFSRLVERFSPRLTRFLRHGLGDPHHAEDVLQDVWLEVWSGRDQLGNVEAFQAWLFGVAKNLANRHRRGELYFVSLDECNEPALLDDVVDKIQFRECLGKLSPEHRTVIELRFIENLAYEEIAARTKCDLGTVRSRLHRAKRRLYGWAYSPWLASL